MAMIQSRNLSSHTYNKQTVGEIAAAILNSFVAEFHKFRAKFAALEFNEP